MKKICLFFIVLATIATAQVSKKEIYQRRLDSRIRVDLRQNKNGNPYPMSYAVYTICKKINVPFLYRLSLKKCENKAIDRLKSPRMHSRGKAKDLINRVTHSHGYVYILNDRGLYLLYAPDEVERIKQEGEHAKNKPTEKADETSKSKAKPPQDKSEQEEKAPLKLPQVALQNDQWSSGANCIARLLNAYGRQATYSGVKNAIGRDQVMFHIPMGGGKKRRNKRVDICSPERVSEVFHQLGLKAISQTLLPEPFTRIKTLLDDKKPVMAMCRAKNILDKPQLPTFRWVIIAGYDDKAEVFQMYRPDADEPVQLAYGEFLEIWDWNIDHSYINRRFAEYKIQPRSIVWIDEDLPKTKEVE